MEKYDYTQRDLEEALAGAGVRAGDSLFVHCSIGFYGRAEGVKNAGQLCGMFLSALKNAVTDRGTVVLPAFSYSFCRGEVYDPKTAASDCGMLSEFAVKQGGMIRSLDPNFSIVSWGRLSEEYAADPAHESFGEGSFWERLLKSGGKIVCMNMDCGSTFVHYAERRCSVPYRHNKAFNGVIHVSDEEEYEDYAVHYVFEKDKDRPFFGRLDKKCREEGICRSRNAGKGTVLAMDVKEYFDLICRTLEKEPRFLTAGG